jgi:hypothetical protein
MTAETTIATVATVATEAVVATVATTPKSVAQRASRKRFSFGPTWNAAVISGKATDEAKLLEQAIALKVGTKSDLRKLKLATLRTKVAAKLQADQSAPADEVVSTVLAADGAVTA